MTRVIWLPQDLASV